MNQWLEKHRTAVLAGVGVLIALAGLVFALRWRQPAAIVVQPPLPSQTPGPIRVYVSGAVVNPGVVALPASAIAQDAVQAAGGASQNADLDRVNLAQPLHDGQQLYVPYVGEASTAGAVSPGGAVPASGPVNINTATQAELETLPHIGPALADRIIKYREQHGPFVRIEDIQNVPGIGPATFALIQDLITVK